METNKQLELAYEFVRYTNRNIFLTGKAGTGKTTFLRDLRQKSPKRMIVVAPTGVAAINAGGVTIHSFFQLSFGPQVGSEHAFQKEMRFSKEKINIIRSLDLLIIDEISMVRADLLDGIDRVLRRFRERDKPFGGVQLLMIGDLQQLAPVVKDDEWELLKTRYNTPYFFSSKILRETSYVSIELTHVYRQQDDEFISILNQVRDNRLNKEALQKLNLRYIPDFKPGIDQGFITLCTHNIQARRLNESKLQQLTSRLKIFTATVEADFPEYYYPTDFELKLKVGAQVMFVKNDPSSGNLFYNGKIGKVTRITEDTVYVLCPDESSEIEVTKLIWENTKYTVDKNTSEIKASVEGTFSQLPLKLAWAITIHKSQGLTFEHAIIDAEASFAHGQVYVALSRCKTLEGMVLSTPISNHSIINDATVSGFIQHTEQNQPDEKELNSARLAYQYELVTNLFNFDKTMMFLNSVLKLMRENRGSVPEVTVELFRQIREQTLTDIAKVADKFLGQVKQLLTTIPDIEKNTRLLGRLSKAATYFGEKVQTVLIDKLAKADLETDNKALRKQINSLAERLSEEIGVKIAGYKICEKGFQVKKLLDARAKVLIEYSTPVSVKRKAPQSSTPDRIPYPGLYNALRSWRFAKAAEMDVPAYMIFSQKALVELALYLPVEMKTLRLIKGMGEKKISSFGEKIIHIIQEYCGQNNIDRMKIPVKENPEKLKKPKPDSKKISYDYYKEGNSVEEIAVLRGLSQTTIESHLSYYVGKGELDVKLFLSGEKLKRILSYFEKASNKSLSPAREALGKEFSYGDLRFGASYREFLERK